MRPVVELRFEVVAAIVGAKVRVRRHRVAGRALRPANAPIEPPEPTFRHPLCLHSGASVETVNAGPKLTPYCWASSRAEVSIQSASTETAGVADPCGVTAAQHAQRSALAAQGLFPVRRGAHRTPSATSAACKSAAASARACAGVAPSFGPSTCTRASLRCTPRAVSTSSQQTST